MSKYRKKPVVIDAFQLNERELVALIEFMLNTKR